MRPIPLLSALLTVLSLCGCNSVLDNRIPATAVNVQFKNTAIWDRYGATGPLDHQRFIKADRLPSGFPYDVSMATGYGGIMLICTANNELRAFDLACPVEVRPTTRIRFDADKIEFVCPQCHSTFHIETGMPMTGEAADRHYALQSYYIYPTTTGGYAISR
jgi:hypothetical protein